MPDSTRERVTPTSPPRSIVGWDIGGVNTKAARVEGGMLVAGRTAPLEIQRDPGRLTGVLRCLASELGPPPTVHAVTMTAELSQAFRTKREGVGFVLDAVAGAFPGSEVRVYTVAGSFLTLEAARARPLEVAAANWAATARLVGGVLPDCILIDIGTTSTDIIPVVGGEPAALGATDPARLRSRELVYTGALRTPAEAIATTVPLWGGACPVSAEGFALIGDVHLWLGRLAPADYTTPTPDGRPATRLFAGERLARVVCADREMLDDAAIDAIASALAEAQVAGVTEAVGVVRARHPGIERACVAGLGAFIGAEAARRVGLTVEPLAERLGEAARIAPAAAVALLLAAAPAGVRS